MRALHVRPALRVGLTRAMSVRPHFVREAWVELSVHLYGMEGNVNRQTVWIATALIYCSAFPSVPRARVRTRAARARAPSADTPRGALI